jgi:hypothetical protein
MSLASLQPLEYSNQGGRPHGIQVMVYRERPSIGQARYGGFTVLDVSNPRDPKPAGFVPTGCNALNLQLQVHSNLLLVVDSANLFSIYGG